MPTKAVVLHEQAGVDYDSAFEWYLERSANAAFRFHEAVEKALTEICQAPQRWPHGSYGTRRLLLRGFPYLLIYREHTANVVQILAVAHTSRRQGYWQDRV